MLEGVPNLINEPWRRHFADQSEQSNAVPAITTVTIAARNSAISATPIPAGVLSAGLYRITVYTRIVTAAVTSSSARPDIVFTDDADVCTMAGTAVTGNTTTTVGSSTFLVRIDAGSPISYVFAYASNGAGEMEYEAEIVLEQIG
jgi:hypothetical protein